MIFLVCQPTRCHLFFRDKEVQWISLGASNLYLKPSGGQKLLLIRQDDDLRMCLALLITYQLTKEISAVY